MRVLRKTVREDRIHFSVSCGQPFSWRGGRKGGMLARTIMAGTCDIDEKALVKRAAAGDRQALRALYDAHSRRAYALALRLTGSAEDAEEIVQEAFMRAFRALGGFRAESRFSTWLYRIVVNRSNDLMARRARQRKKEISLDVHEPAGPDTGSDPMQRRRIEKALEGLPEGYRNVLLLHDMLGLDHGEIAKILGIRRGTSKSQLHKARAWMRRALGG
ncbi:MAG: RNA polymerase sigma factor [Deltaproteobacteria bacterium]|nr:MAG: RNA polymerase sigma factor [Deltaproteobacteria bacterium]